MRTTQGSTLQSLRTVQSFLLANADKLADVNNTGVRHQLDDAIAELSTHTATQSGSQLTAMGLTQKQNSLRQALMREHMVPIARIAKIKLPPTPEVAPLRMPHGRPTVERLAAAAYGMAKAAEPFQSVFVAAAMPVDFIARLTAAADAMVAAMSNRSESQGSRRGATTGLKTTLSDGRKIVHVLDALVQIALQNDPSLLANWNSVKRVRVIPTRPAKPDESTPATPASPTPPSTTTEPATHGG